MQFHTRILIAVVSLLILGSCGLFSNLSNRESQRYSFAPTVEGVQHTGQNYQTGACPGVFLDRRGTGSIMLFEWERTGGLEEQGMLVGYSSALARGDDPFPCNLWVHHNFQGKALFDLGAIPADAIVQSARLSYTRNSRPVTDRGVASTPCNYTIGTASGLSTSTYDYESGPANAMDDRPTRPNNRLEGSSADVTRSVFNWVRDGASDTWFVFSMEDGRAFTEHDETDQFAYCNLNLDDLALEVTALVQPET